MQDLNWEVVSAIRANRKKAQEPIYITKNLFLYIIARYRSCGEAYWRGRRALEDDLGHAVVATAPRRHAPRPPPLLICIYAASPPSAMSTPYSREAALANDDRQAVNARWRRIVGSESHAPGRLLSARSRGPRQNWVPASRGPLPTCPGRRKALREHVRVTHTHEARLGNRGQGQRLSTHVRTGALKFTS